MIVAQLLALVFNIASFIIIAQVLIHWLVNFGVLNTKNEQAKNLVELLHKITNPIFSKVRKYVPPIGGLDLTPLIILVGLMILESLVMNIVYRSF